MIFVTVDVFSVACKSAERCGGAVSVMYLRKRHAVFKALDREHEDALVILAEFERHLG